MALHADLLEQANHLANRESGRPKQASLRRAVSSAYYALFHLLASEAASAAAPATPSNLRAQIQRALVHGDMKHACVGITSRMTNPVFVDLAGEPSHDLTRLATVFVELQEARHKADYDLLAKFSRTDVQLLVQQCRSAFSAWKTIRGTDEANVFLAALLSGKRWTR